MKGALLAVLASLGLAAVQAHAGEAAGWQPIQLPHSSQRDLHSQRTGKDYRIFVSEPRHAPPPGGYPVLYVLDGNALFPGLAIQAQALEDRPDPNLRDSVLVVGIGYPGEALYDFKARAEDYTPKADDRQRLPGREPPPSGGADDFLAFIEDELKPQIAQRYPVDARRQTLFGHSYGGLFTLYTLFTKPQAFRAMWPPARRSGGTRAMSNARSKRSNGSSRTSLSPRACWSRLAVPNSPRRVPPWTTRASAIWPSGAWSAMPGT
ncbi:alpha/beta hydrolase [Stutzerimonas kunmingensis]|uniref:alpha/beta hydrolase n=1 Tax=Stutzerimonas kunmingensis TaxID=1211807 RepID=UPI00241D1280|nr:alpha/beta hydrolase-fold protein [Stutzerimonas kunmingensis]